MIFKGKFVNVFPVIPYGSLRRLQLQTKNGNKYLLMHWKILDREVKNIPLGATVEIDYRSYDTFTIRET